MSPADFERDPDIPLLRRSLIYNGTAPVGAFRGRRSKIAEHLELLSAEFSGRTALEFYVAALNVHLRRGIDVEANIARLLRVLREEGPFLLRMLNARWLKSVCDSIAEFCDDSTERAAAFSATLFLNTVRLYETERRLYGAPPVVYEALPRGTTLFDGLTPFTIGEGDMVHNLLRRARLPFPDHLVAPKILQECIRRMLLADSAFRRIGEAHRKDATRWSLPRRTAALIVDADVARNYGFAGAVKTLEDLAASGNMEIVRYHLRGDMRDNIGAKAAIERSDVVVAISARPISRSSDSARRIVAVARHCSTIGKRIFLANATIQANDVAITDDLRAFDHIWVRESASSRELAAAGIAHSVCPDLSLLQSFQTRSDPEPGTTIVVDSGSGAASRTLAAWATEAQSPFASMAIDLSSDVYRFAAEMGRHERMIAGRMSAVCLALALKMPFHATASNTFEIEAMLADIGLQERLVGRSDRLPEHRPFTAEEVKKIDAYLDRAKASSHQMLRIISA